MKTRHVFSTPDITAAEAAVNALRQAGVADDDISLVARHDIETAEIEDNRLEHGSDFGGGAVKGLLAGGGSGLLVGLVAIGFPPIGITLAGAAALTAAGAAVGSWAGMLAGSAAPSPVRRKFEEEIEAGRVLVAVDGEEEELATADATLQALGATPLPFEALSAIS